MHRKFAETQKQHLEQLNRKDQLHHKDIVKKDQIIADLKDAMNKRENQWQQEKKNTEDRHYKERNDKN